MNRQHLKKRIKEYSLSCPIDKIYFKAEYLGENGDAEIDIDLNKGIELYNPISYGCQIDINPEIVSYIDEKAEFIPLYFSLSIIFHGNASDKDKQKIESVLRERFNVEFRKSDILLKRNFAKIAGLAIFGVILLSVFFALQVLNLRPIFMEVLSIAGSFALWEAVDEGILLRSELKLNRMKAFQKAQAKIKFIK